MPFITRLSSSGSGFGKNSTQLPTYNVIPSTTSVNEGSSVTFTINTTLVPDSTTLYYTITGVSGTVNSSDFTTSLTGSFTITSSTGSVVATLDSDETTEGTETFKFRVHTGSTSGPIVAESSTITINDTSIIPAYIDTYLFKTPRQFNQPASNWTVPSGTTHIWVRMVGSGGIGENYPNSYSGGDGGAGGFTTGVMSVSAGETLKVAVGDNSNNGRGQDSYAPGGGFSGILRGPTTPGASEPNFTSVLIAGGGGGGQVNTNYAHSYSSGHAGAGGGSNGQPGYPNYYPGGAPSTGGTQSSGGNPARQGPSYPGGTTYGSYLKGGTGSGGGGGGGYYGGGGDGTTYTGGGAGGSGYTGGAYSNGATYTGSRRSVSPQMYTPDYPLLGVNPIEPTVPWGNGGQGGNGPYPAMPYKGRGNGFVIIHCFRRAPTASDFPGTFTVTATY